MSLQVENPQLWQTKGPKVEMARISFTRLVR